MEHAQRLAVATEKWAAAMYRSELQMIAQPFLHNVLRRLKGMHLEALRAEEHTLRISDQHSAVPFLRVLNGLSDRPKLFGMWLDIRGDMTPETWEIIRLSA